MAFESLDFSSLFERDPFAILREKRAQCGKRPCDDCQLYACHFCGEINENAPSEFGDHRPSVCDACRWRWERMLDLRCARGSLPKPYHFDLDASEIVERVPGYQGAQKRVLDALACQRNVILYGVTGSGKSTLAVSMLGALVKRAEDRRVRDADVRRAIGVYYTTAFDVASAWDTSRLGEVPRVVERCSGASVLCIDELGAELKTDRRLALDQIIHMRYNSSKPLWICTPFGSKAIEEKYGSGVIRRFVESSIVIHLQNPKARPVENKS